MAETFNYDVFVSHSSRDKAAVRELASRLKADGMRVWFDEWEIKPGDIIGLKIEEGLEQSRTLVLVMSVNAFASEWVTLERHTALFRDPTNAQRRFIPLRLDDAKINDMLKQFAYVDWRLKSVEEYARLLAACRPPVVAVEPTLEQQSKGQLSKVLIGHTKAVWGVAVTPDGRRIVSGSADNTLRLWDMETGKSLATLEGHTDVVREVTVTPDGRHIVSGSRDKTVRVWELPTDKMGITEESGATRYTNAKVLLVGDTVSARRGWLSVSPKTASSRLSRPMLR